MERYESGGRWGVLVFFIIQNPSNLGELKNCIGEVWRVLGKFWKISLFFLLISSPSKPFPFKRPNTVNITMSWHHILWMHGVDNFSSVRV